jgi:hypothetical protein
VTVELKAVTEAMFQLGRVEDIKVITGDTVGRLKEFAELKPDWDSYGADPIQWSTIGRAIDFFTQVIDVAPLVPLPFVAPSPDGSIFFEWESCSRSIKNYIPSSPQELIEFLLVDKSSGRIDRTAGKADTLGVMVNIIREWFAK